MRGGKPWHIRPPHRCRRGPFRIIGLILMILGGILIIKVIPINFWLLIFAFVIFITGLLLYKCG
ncbi:MULTISPECIES: hypothetical protein [Tissierellales]|uniref:Uncharacterized protein n=1 Tax=Acidilutibacter cellobiosedens TaxID=2507161 RepID=A0A410QC62_9FIRM|nr:MULTISPECIES: hypothetical protein [Tissierellales]MBE6082444.1 hypothetical protein [Tissierellaceae bacterium]QAT61560.1 hypothetical protein EQM13_08195 [Acidilutibacter cellobiosedens]SCL83369.1 hypothetical protein PP176A_0455 [Sporanaerobacter sp. PP17-6a]